MDCCKQPGFLRKRKGTQHFYHKSKHENCNWKDESPEHEQLKYQIYKICKSEGWTVQTEVRSDTGEWIADVLARKNKRTIVFEVQLSKITITDLEDRDKKYRNKHIESYWILKNFLNQQQIDCYNENIQDRFLLSPIEFVKQSDLILKCEDVFLLKKINSIGINPPYQCLYSQSHEDISVDTWVKDVLAGNYSRNLKSRHKRILKEIALLKRAISVIEKYDHSTKTYRRYNEKITNYSKFDNIHDVKQELDSAFNELSNVNARLRIILSEKNGFSQSSNGTIAFQLLSSSQIEAIERLLQDIVLYEDRIKRLIQKIENTIVQKSPIFYKEPFDQPSKKERQEIPYPFIKFRFNVDLPTQDMESSRGQKYRNPWGCTWDIDERDAKEFEKLGLGRIVH